MDLYHDMLTFSQLMYIINKNAILRYNTESCLKLILILLLINKELSQ